MLLNANVIQIRNLIPNLYNIREIPKNRNVLERHKLLRVGGAEWRKRQQREAPPKSC